MFTKKNISDILAPDRPASEIIADLKQKDIMVPPWDVLEKDYYSIFHPVMNKAIYPDIVKKDGTIEKVTRITLGLQKLATKRMTELVFGIPVKRVYKSETENHKKIAKVIEAIFQRNRIDSVNIMRGRMLFAGCEAATLWYAVEQKNNIYGIDSPIKLRCRNFSPMKGDKIYPLFDQYDDMIALSIGYMRKEGIKSIEYFDTYTSDRHIKWANDGSGWVQIEDDNISIGKIPGVYVYRPEPIWEDTSRNVYEIESALSRNGNYLRRNSKPIFAVFTDDSVKFGGEKDNESKSVFQYAANANAKYITWDQAIDNLKFFTNELKQMFFTQLQLPDMSYENMKTMPMSGEARKMMFIDAQLKVEDESGPLLEMLDREVNVVKAFVKAILPVSMHADIDTLQVETQITPFSITDDKDTINNIMTATGGRAIMSQKEGIEQLGWSKDAKTTLKEIQQESMNDVYNLNQ